jgi:hypothetical protein
MNPFFLHPDTKDLKDQLNEPMLLPFHEQQYSTSNGGEFLDDAIRMEDLSIIHTGESITNESLYKLL